MTSSIKTFKCDCCAYVYNRRNKNVIHRHLETHKQPLNIYMFQSWDIRQLNKDIINYVRFNRQIKYCCQYYMFQSCNVYDIITIKELIDLTINNIGGGEIKFPSINEIDFSNCIGKNIRNEHGISNINGCFVGLYAL